jgi:hypothetical protein
VRVAASLASGLAGPPVISTLTCVNNKIRLVVLAAAAALLTGCGPAAPHAPGAANSPSAGPTPSAAAEFQFLDPAPVAPPTKAAVQAPAPPTAGAHPPKTVAPKPRGGTTNGRAGGGAAGHPTPAPTGCGADSYRNSDGVCVHRPAEGPDAPDGATALCRDGEYSYSLHRSGSCSGHGGVARWLRPLP